jgi:hypothetical protein
MLLTSVRLPDLCVKDMQAPARAGANPAIVVGNAQPLLVDWLTARQQDARVVLTDAPMADGILEGLARLGLY